MIATIRACSISGGSGTIQGLKNGIVPMIGSLIEVVMRITPFEYHMGKILSFQRIFKADGNAYFESRQMSNVL